MSSYEPKAVYGDMNSFLAASSIAISLKRIADALCGDGKNLGLMEALIALAQEDEEA